MKQRDTLPPSLPGKLLQKFLRHDLAEEVLGDLDEKFYRTKKHRSSLRAKVEYWYQVIHYLRPFAIRKIQYNSTNSFAMFENYYRIAWRNLLKQRMYSSIKIGGFALGIAACLLIALYIRQELSYDQHYVNKDRIYRLGASSVFRGEESRNVWFPAPMNEALLDDYPEFELTGDINPVDNFGAGSNEVRRIDRQESTHEEGFVFATQSILDILEVPFIAGNPKRGLTDPNTIVLTESKAKQYFPDEDPIGKTLILNNDESRQYKITGVIADFPVTSHFHYDFLITLEGKEFWEGEQTNWRASNYLNYVRVRPGVNIPELEAKLTSITTKYYLPATKGTDADKNEIEWLRSLRFQLQPVSDIYLNRSGAADDDFRHGDIRYIWLFGAIAGFILFIACINFINLSTARSANRAKEVGLRKVVGSMRTSLISQFLIESVMFSMFSFIAGIFLAALLLPWFIELVGKPLIFPWNEWWLFPLLGTSALIIGVIAGAYPSFYLSSFRPAAVLKGNVSLGSKSSGLRNTLVVFQFMISIILIVGSLVVNNQMDYILTKKVGFDKDHVILLHGTHTLKDQVIPFKNELVSLSDVNNATVTSFIPITGNRRNGSGMWTKEIPEEESVGTQQWFVDEDYINTLGIKLIEGRGLSEKIASDSQAMVVNQAFVKAFGWKSAAGKEAINWKGPWTIVGVMEDFHFESMRQSIEPLALQLRKSRNMVAVNVRTNDMEATLAQINSIWKRFSPNQSIRYTFMDESYARTYADVQRVGKIFTSFTVLAIVVACLGLFALSAFMVEQRGKEISIRLVLGASVNQVFGLLTGNFMKLILISFVLAAPIGWYLMKLWLEDYVYKVDLGLSIFIWSGVGVVVIALATISYQSIRAALISPVTNLKSE
jgi:putative ABC transport system permease protein